MSHSEYRVCSVCKTELCFSVDFSYCTDCDEKVGNIIAADRFSKCQTMSQFMEVVILKDKQMEQIEILRQRQKSVYYFY
jgi:hypothetical protein